MTTKHMSRFEKSIVPWNKGLRGLSIGTRPGTKFSDSHRKNLSISHTGMKYGSRGGGREIKCVWCGGTFHFVGKKRARRYCSRVCYGLARRGASHPMWRGGTSKERELAHNRIEYKNWRTEVFSRDGYACVQCGAEGVYLHADHIKQWAFYPDLRYEVGNGRTLCVPCHKKTPTWGKQSA